MSVLFSIIPLITYKYSFTLIFTIVEVILFICFLMKMNEPKVAQKIINVLLILGVLNFILTGIKNPANLPINICGLIIRGAYALSYYYASHAKIDK